jgi:hypothetical protein
MKGINAVCYRTYDARIDLFFEAGLASHFDADIVFSQYANSIGSEFILYIIHALGINITLDRLRTSV